MGKTYRKHDRDDSVRRPYAHEVPPAVRPEDRSLRIVPPTPPILSVSIEGRRQNRPPVSAQKPREKVAPCKDATGEVKFIKEDKGYGFITLDESPWSGRDIFFHRNSVLRVAGQPQLLKPGDKVMFDVELDKRDPSRTCAASVRKL